MRVLFVGGTGIISSACSRLLLARGVDLHLICRGMSPRPLPTGAVVHNADVRDPKTVETALGALTFDAVVNFIAFEPEHVEADIHLFQRRTAQYVFISSASAYKKPVHSFPITEATPLHNPYWQYSRNKAACEERLLQAYKEQDFPVTIVRPSHTYDKTLLPFDPHGCGYTVLSRMLAGKPVVVHGDGTSLWTLTHHRDFAVGFAGLLGRPKAIGEAFHITSDELLTWNQIYETVAAAAGVKPTLVHVASDTIAKEHPAWGEALRGDKAHSAWFDNTKIKRLVPEYCAKIPFAQGAREIVQFYGDNPTFQPVNAQLDAVLDDLVKRFS